MFGDHVLNLTPHSITVYAPQAPDRAEPGDLYPAGILPVAGPPARIEAAYGDSAELVIDDGLVSGCFGIPTRTVQYASRVVNLPDPVPGTLHLVSLPVALAAAGRADLLVVDREVRNLAGTVIGCRALARVIPAGRRSAAEMIRDAIREVDP